MTEYRRCQGKSYMIIESDVAVGGYEYPMLVKNRILGLLPLKISNKDEHMQFWYEISGKQSLEDWMKIKKLGSVFLKQFFTSLEEIIGQTGEYLLEESGISLAPEHIYIDSEKKDIFFCFLPFEKHTLNDSLGSFMEYYLSHMAHSEREGTQKCYEVYEICQKENADIKSAIQILYEEENADCAGKEMEPQELSAEKNILKETPQKFQDKIQNKIQNKLLDKKLPEFLKAQRRKKCIQESYSFEPEDYPQESKNPTVFLGCETEQILGELKYEGNGTEQNMTVTSPVFLIGSRKEETDGVLHNETVSRIHARITKEKDSYYLEDMNSTNGTYHNGELLNYKEKVLLEKNDKISFAKENYRFV